MTDFRFLIAGCCSCSLLNVCCVLLTACCVLFLLTVDRVLRGACDLLLTSSIRCRGSQGVAASHGKMSATAAAQYVKEMQAKGRLVQELWS